MKNCFLLLLISATVLLFSSCKKESATASTNNTGETHKNNLGSLQKTCQQSPAEVPGGAPTSCTVLVKAGGQAPFLPEPKLQIPGYNRAQEDYSKRCKQNFENNYYNSGIYSKESTNCPIRRKISLLDEFHGGVIHIINEDCILKDMDLWDTKSMEYLLTFPYSKQVQEFSYPFLEEEQRYWLYQYDSRKQSLGIRFRSRGRAGNGVNKNYICGEYCYGVNLKTLEYEASFKHLGSNIYLTPRSIGQVFQKNGLKSLTDISSPMRMLHIESSSDMNSIPLLSYIQAKKEKSLHLTPYDIDAQHLKIKKSATQPECTNKIYSTFRFEEQMPPTRDIPGLPDNSSYTWEQNVFKPKNCRGYDIVNAGKRGEIYMYCEEEKLLIRLWDCEGYSPGFEIPDTYALGYSDMGIRTLSCSNRLYRGEPNEWLPPRQALTENLPESINLVYSDSQENMQEWCQERKKLPTIMFDAPSDYARAERYSVWNRVPGERDKAYWITVGGSGCSFFLIDLASGTGKLMQHWNTLENVFFIPERNWLCFEKGENGWEVIKLDLNKGESTLLFNMYSFGRNQYAIVLPNGLYAGSPGCESSLYLSLGQQSMDLAAYAPWRNRPAEVLSALGGNPDSITALRETTRRWLQKKGWNPDSMPLEPSPGNFPVAVVTRPKPITEQTTIDIPVKLYATARDIEQLQVKADDISIPQPHIQTGEQFKGEREVRVNIPLHDGLNRLSITPIDSAGIAGKTTSFFVFSQQESKSQLYIVSLGVSDYSNDELDLKYAAKDAADVAQSLAQAANSEVHQLVLTDEEVSDKTVLKKISDFLSSATIHDKIIIYLAGHGVLDSRLDYYFAPSNFNPERIHETGISWDELTSCIKSSPARERLLMLDTCHSGLMREESEEKLARQQHKLPPGIQASLKRGMKLNHSRNGLTYAQRKRYIDEMFSMGSNDLELNLISAADGAGYALESEQWQNGVYAASVIHILSNAKDYDDNQNGILSVHELQSSVCSTVEKWTGGEQTPSGVIIPNSGMHVAESHVEQPKHQSNSESAYHPKGRTFENEAEDIVDKYMMFCCTGNEHLLGYLFADTIDYKNENKTMTASEYLSDFSTYKEKWPQRQYKVQHMGFKNSNTVEIVYVYICSDKKSKQTQGCSKTILTVNKEFKVTGIEEKISRKQILPLSPGMTKRLVTPGYYDTRHYEEDNKYAFPNFRIDSKGRISRP